MLIMPSLVHIDKMPFDHPDKGGAVNSDKTEENLICIHGRNF